MFIRNCLTERKLLNVVHPEQTIQEALTALKGHLSLPCVSDTDEFVGMVSKRTIFEAFLSAHEQEVSYEEFLKRPLVECLDRTVKTLTLNDDFEDTIDIIIRHPFVPIVEDKKLIGIVKRGDVNGALSVAFATDVESHRILLGIPEMEGALQRLFSVTHKLSVNVITAIPFDAGPKVLNRRVILKVSKTPELDDLVHQLEKAGFLIIELTK